MKTLKLIKLKARNTKKERKNTQEKDMYVIPISVSFCFPWFSFHLLGLETYYTKLTVTMVKVITSNSTI